MVKEAENIPFDRLPSASSLQTVEGTRHMRGMPPALRWLVLVVLVMGVPYILVWQAVESATYAQGHAQSGQIPGLIAGLLFLIITLVMALQLPALYVRFYDAKKLAGNTYQNHLRAFGIACEKAGVKPTPELYVINESAPHALGVGLLPSQRKILFTRGLFDSLDPDQFEAYLDFILIEMARGDLGAMTFGAAAAYIYLLPLKIADLADSDGLRVLLTVIFGWFGAIYIQASGIRSDAYELDQIAGALRGMSGHLALGSALNDGSKVLFKHQIQRLDYSSAPLFVVNPLGTKGVAGIFATHAPTPKRVKKLQTAGKKIVGKERVAKSKGLV